MKSCKECRSRFKPARREQEYCSKSCASVRKGHMCKGRKTGPRRGWIYGRRLDKDGYVKLYAGNHPYADGRLMISEHVMKMELKLGRRINTRIEIVHHKNDVKTDNRLSNLELMTRAEHSRLHGLESHAKRKRTIIGRFA